MVGLLYGKPFSTSRSHNWPVHTADNLTTFMCWLSWNLGASTHWNPQDLSRPVMGLLYHLGHVVVQWLRHCATNRKVTGSIPDGVVGILRWHNPFSPTMVLTQPLTEMITRNISWGWRQPMRRADNLATFMCWLCWNLEASSSWNPQGLSRPVIGLVYLLYPVTATMLRAAVDTLCTENPFYESTFFPSCCLWFCVLTFFVPQGDVTQSHLLHIIDTCLLL
jgi:hypothetical protein